MLRDTTSIVSNSQTHFCLSLDCYYHLFNPYCYLGYWQCLTQLACGPRIYTVFVYLNDVEEGGGTNFPDAFGHDDGVTVQPKRGRIAMWPSVMNDNVRAQDPRTVHQALPVEKGVKYGANHWIHLHDYRIPNWWGCTGSFDE
jgi:hypothetical protein